MIKSTWKEITKRNKLSKSFDCNPRMQKRKMQKRKLIQEKITESLSKRLLLSFIDNSR